MTSLDEMFSPRAVVVVGASERREGPRLDRIKGLVRSKQLGKFKGELYAVNPKYRDVLGVPCYPRLLDIAEPVDYVVVAVPAREVPGVLDDCAAKHVKTVVVFSSGFSEESVRTGLLDGEHLQAQLVQKARQGGYRLVGPNCLGLYYSRSGLVMTPDQAESGIEGGISFVSQSGGAIVFPFRMCVRLGLGICKMASIGNSADLNVEELIDYYADDDETKVIFAYIESVRNGRKLFEALKRASAAKPVIVMKGGVTEAGVRVAASHTAALSQHSNLYSAVFKQTNSIAVNSFEEMTDVALALHASPRISGRRVAFITYITTANAVDIITRGGLELPHFDDVGNAIKDLAFNAGEVNTMTTNPIDLGESMPVVLGPVIELVGSEPSFDLVVIYQSLEFVSGFVRKTGVSPADYARSIVEKRDIIRKPMIMVFQSIQADSRAVADRLEIERELTKGGVPIFPSLERASRAITLTDSYYVRRNVREERGSEAKREGSIDPNAPTS